jgi:hypothetical protein
MDNGDITRVHLLAEIEDLLRTMPPRETIRHETSENLSWLGRIAAAIELWNPIKNIQFRGALRKFHHLMAREAGEGFREIIILLNQARSDLRLRTLGPSNVAIAQGSVFDYFDELRKIVELAIQDVFFVDPYLDAEFIARYLPNVRSGVPARLLTSDKKLNTLLPSVDLFMQQSHNPIHVRSANGLHDRYVFIDKESCYQSGAYFKDGAKQAPTTLTQITDVCDAVLDIYEQLWSSAKVER